MIGWTRARHAFREGDFETCERILREIAGRPDERPFALYNLSVLYAETGRPDWKSFYEEAVEARPDLLSAIGARTLLRSDEFSGVRRRTVGETDMACPDVEVVPKG